MEVLEPWVVVAAAGRGLLYGALLLAAGSALFVLLVAPSRVALRVGQYAAIAALVFTILAVGLGGAAMVGGAGALILPDAWQFGMNSSAGSSALLGVPSMLVLWTGFRRMNRPALAAGVLVGVGSFLVTGHAATAAPAWLMVPAVFLHLICAAFWLGALAPLFAVADQPEAPDVFARFSTRAIVAVALLGTSGIVISAVQLASLTALFTTDYGRLLVAKLALVALLIGLAAANRLLLTPRLATGAAAMRRSILIEIVLFALVLAVAASLTAVPPPRAL